MWFELLTYISSALIALTFIILLFFKVRSRHSIALHRNRENIRRGWGQPVDFDTMGIPIVINPHVPRDYYYVTNLDGNRYIQTKEFKIPEE